MKTQSVHGRKRLAATLFGVVITGCARYHSAPLPSAPDLSSTPILTAPAAQFLLPGLPPHLLPQDGLDETTIVTLAVFNDPDMKAARLQSGVADAQLLEAGLIPDPQLSAGIAASALHYGYSLGVEEDIRALLLRGAAKKGAIAHQKQINLNILWQEWQVAERARELFIQVRADEELQVVLSRSHKLLSDQYQHDEIALQEGNVTSATTSADITLLADADASLRQCQLDSSLAHHNLNQLLGLQPDVELKLTGPRNLKVLSAANFQFAIAQLPKRRVDLVALQAGYQSQEENLRRAILAQFPSLSAGVEQGRDPAEGIHSAGLNVSLTLPIFNRNRGQIAIQSATREVLLQTYRAQLDFASNQADLVWRSTQILQEQLGDLDAQLAILKNTATAAGTNFHHNDLDAALYISLQSTLLSKQLEEIRLRADLDRAQAVLATILGLPFEVPHENSVAKSPN